MEIESTLEGLVDWATRNRLADLDPLPGPIELSRPEGFVAGGEVDACKAHLDRVSEWADDLASDEHSTTRQTLFQGLFHLCEAHAYDFAKRFVAVGVLAHVVSHLDGQEFETEHEQISEYPELGNAIQNGQEDLVHLVGQVAVERCPREWTLVRWEIQLAYLVNNLDRALRLMDLGREVGKLSPVEILRAKGQVQFMYAIQNAYGPSWRWSRQASWMYPLASPLFESDQYRSQISGVALHTNGLIREWTLLKTAVCGKEPGDTTIEGRTLLHDSIGNLEKAGELDSLSGLDQIVLARSYFEVKQFQNAARHYTTGLSALSSVTNEWGADDFLRDLLKELRRAQVFALKKAGDLPAAEGVVRAWLSGVPHPAYEDVRLLAELQHEQGNFQAIHETMSAWRESGPTETPPEEWLLSTLVAVGKLAFPDRTAQARGFLGRSPDVEHLIEALVTDYWPRYRTLCETARHAWQLATFMRHGSFEACEGAMRQTAPVQFALAVECELRSRVFHTFRSHGEHGRIAGFTRAESSDDDLARRFAKFLDNKGGKLTFGQMVECLAGRGRGPGFQEFTSWCHRNHPRLASVVEKLRDVVKIRNPEAHGEEGPRNLQLDVASTCRGILDSIDVPREAR